MTQKMEQRIYTNVFRAGKRKLKQSASEGRNLHTLQKGPWMNIADQLLGRLRRFEITPEEYQRRYTAMMTGEEFTILYQDTELRKKVCEIARSYTRNPETAEELVQEAWLLVAEQECGKDEEFYLAIARAGVESAYRRMWRRSDRRLDGRTIEDVRRESQKRNTRERVRKYRARMNRAS